MTMKPHATGLRGASPILLLLIILLIPAHSRAQRSARSSATVTFAVLPVHSTGATISSPTQMTEKVTVSVRPAYDVRIGLPTPTVRDMLLTPTSPRLHPPPGSSVIFTITE
jgi:hypothetical protein